MKVQKAVAVVSVDSNSVVEGGLIEDVVGNDDTARTETDEGGKEAGRRTTTERRTTRTTERMTTERTMMEWMTKGRKIDTERRRDPVGGRKKIWKR